MAVDYLCERIKRETRSKMIQQSGYLIVRGLVTRKGENDGVFKNLDRLFDIPQEEEKPKKSKEELIDEFENYLKTKESDSK